MKSTIPKFAFVHLCQKKIWWFPVNRKYQDWYASVIFSSFIFKVGLRRLLGEPDTSNLKWNEINIFIAVEKWCVRSGNKESNCRCFVFHLVGLYATAQRWMKGLLKIGKINSALSWTFTKYFKSWSGNWDQSLIRFKWFYIFTFITFLQRFFAFLDWNHKKMWKYIFFYLFCFIKRISIFNKSV